MQILGVLLPSLSFCSHVFPKVGMFLFILVNERVFMIQLSSPTTLHESKLIQGALGVYICVYVDILYVTCSCIPDEPLHICIYIYIHIHIYIYTHTYMYIYIYMLHVYIYIHIHIYIYTHTYMYIYIYMLHRWQSFVSKTRPQTHCNTLQHTATHCNTLQHTATHCNTLQHTATHRNTL